MRRIAITLVLVLGAIGFSPASEAAVPGASYTETGCEGHSDAVARLYVAAFGRTPEADGFDFWVDAYSSAAWTLPAMAAFFVESTEFNARFGAIDDPGFVTQLYNNVLDRGPDDEGLNFWVGQLAADLTRGQLLLRFSESPENITNSGTAHPILGPFNEGITTPFDCDSPDVIELCNAYIVYLERTEFDALTTALGTDAPAGVIAALETLQDENADIDDVFNAVDALSGYVVPICRTRWDRELVPSSDEGSIPTTFFNAVVTGDEAAVTAIAPDDVRAVFAPWEALVADPDFPPTLSFLDDGTNSFAMGLGPANNVVCRVANGTVTSCSFGE